MAQNKDSIVVVLTISRKKMPRWYEYLSMITSGHVRAELIRAHLMPPGRAGILRFAEDHPEQHNDRNTEQHEQAHPTGTDLAGPTTPAGPQAQQYHHEAKKEAGGLASSFIREGNVKWEECHQKDKNWEQVIAQQRPQGE